MHVVRRGPQERLDVVQAERVQLRTKMMTLLEAEARVRENGRSIAFAGVRKTRGPPFISRRTETNQQRDARKRYKRKVARR
jgi:hypothetical protein